LKKKFFTDKRIELLIRFWAAGAVYFFIGWGTGLGTGPTVDFIFILGLVMAIVEMFVVNPVIKYMLNVKSTTGYLDTSVLSKVKYRLSYIFRTILIMAVVAAIYGIINNGATVLFSLPDETVILPGEPIVFSLFYLLVFKLLDNLIINIKRKMKDVKE
jgi:hypothetical protein